jgi:surfeit locus 1 family protein
MLRLIFPLFLGLGGAAILIGLGTWQLQRLDWKLDILRQIETRISGNPGPLPEIPDPVRDQYEPVQAEGALTGEGLYVLVSRKRLGAGYRVIQVLETEGRRILVDRGFLPDRDRPAHQLAHGPLRINGNLLWPVEVDSYTPAPDLNRNMWFARDLPAMAQSLGSEPLLLVEAGSDPSDPAIYPMPVDTTQIPNDHLHYAITWFLLAFVWLGMTGLLVWRIWRKDASDV